MTTQKYIDKITLEYLGTNIKDEDEGEILQIDTSQVNFYKKRLYAAIKQHINALIKSPDNQKNLQSSTDSILREYIDKKIKEFRIEDFADLQMNDLSNSDIINANLEGIEDVNMKDPNTLLYNNPEQKTSTLDDFVIKKTIKTALAPNYPQEKDIMSKKFRYKGVKKNGK